MRHARALGQERPVRRASAGVHHGGRATRPRAALAALFGMAILLAGERLAAEPDLLRPRGAEGPVGCEAVPPCPTSLAAAPDSARPIDLELVWFDPHDLLSFEIEVLASEVQSVFRAVGVEVAFTEGGLYGDGRVPQVPVILLPTDTVPGRPGPPVMGLVRRDESPSRAVWVFHDAVRRVLGQPRRSNDRGTASRWDRPMAIALARVVAHEVVHAIAPDEPHAETGLMRHALGRDVLLAKRAPVDPRCASVFVTELRREARRREQNPRAGSGALIKLGNAASHPPDPPATPPE